MMLGKNILQSSLLLFLLLVLQCAQEGNDDSLSIKDTSWYSFVPIKNDRESEINYEYAEIFIWEKSNEVFNGTAISRAVANGDRAFTIEKLSGSNKFMFTFKDGTTFGIFQIQNDKTAFFINEKTVYKKKFKFRAMEQTNFDFSSSYYHTEQFYEEFKCRHLKAIDIAIKEGFHSGGDCSLDYNEL